MRLRTLPVSLAGIAWAAGIGLTQGRLELVPLLMCLIFAVLAQIASNFANEYFDFRDGLDKPGREGFRRGVTEGDISPRAMLKATAVTLLIACCVGLLLVALYGSPWMYAAGVAIALCALAYSAGPYPLSRHCLGEVAVIIFFGFVPVLVTVLLEGASINAGVVLSALGIGLLGANVLVVNNYRDRDDDAAVGKNTMAVKFGRSTASFIYWLNGVAAFAATVPAWSAITPWMGAIPALFVPFHVLLWLRLRSRKGHELNPVLGMTAMLLAIYALAFLVVNLLV